MEWIDSGLAAWVAYLAWRLHVHKVAFRLLARQQNRTTEAVKELGKVMLGMNE